jgi:hypothetical protein
LCGVEAVEFNDVCGREKVDRLAKSDILSGGFKHGIESLGPSGQRPHAFEQPSCPLLEEVVALILEQILDPNALGGP